jgi:hypothetical protein
MKESSLCACSYRVAPQPTVRATENGLPYGDNLSSTNEVNLLINGGNCVRDTKKKLDAQYKTTSDIQAILSIKSRS